MSSPPSPLPYDFPLPPRRPVDEVMATRRAGELQSRSIKTTAKAAGLRLAMSMVDLTTLEGADSPEKVRGLVRKAIRPYEGSDLEVPVPSCAAVCVYPRLVAVAREAARGTPLKIASVATAFPSGQSSTELRLADVDEAIAAGADEIDMVINRGAFLAGRFGEVADEIARVQERCLAGGAHLKVILETGELGALDQVRFASDLAIAAAEAVPGTAEAGDGAVFIKTSTGKVSPAATPPVVLVMLEAIRDHHRRTGRRIGMKPAGGIRTAKQALQTLVMVKETLGDAWLDPRLFRLGASSLANDLLRQILRLETGRYMAAHDFSEA